MAQKNSKERHKISRAYCPLGRVHRQLALSKRLLLLIPFWLFFVFSGSLASVAHAQQNEGSTRIQLPTYSPQNGHRISGAILEVHWAEYEFAVEAFGFGERIPNGNQAVEGYVYNGQLYKTLPGLDPQEQRWFTSCGMIQLAGTVVINGTHEYQLGDTWAAPCGESWGSSARSIDLPQEMVLESVTFKNVRITGHDIPLVEREIRRLIERHLSEPTNAPKGNTGGGSGSSQSSWSSGSGGTSSENSSSGGYNNSGSYSGSSSGSSQKNASGSQPKTSSSNSNGQNARSVDGMGGYEEHKRQNHPDNKDKEGGKSYIEKENEREEFHEEHVRKNNERVARQEAERKSSSRRSGLPGKQQNERPMNKSGAGSNRKRPRERPNSRKNRTTTIA